MLQLEISMETVCAAAQMAAEGGVPVILDPAPAAPLSEGLLRHVAYLTPNESEADRLTGVCVNDEASARLAAKQLLVAGVGCVIVTLGAKGALLAESDRSVMISARPVKAVDTTAAGDAFNGGLAWALGCGMPLEVAVRKACLVGAVSATRLGAQPSLPTAKELTEFENDFCRLITQETRH